MTDIREKIARALHGEMLRMELEDHGDGCSFEELDEGQSETLERLSDAVLALIQPMLDERERLREGLEQAAENLERLAVPHVVAEGVYNFVFQAAKLARASLTPQTGER